MVQRFLSRDSLGRNEFEELVKQIIELFGPSFAFRVFFASKSKHTMSEEGDRIPTQSSPLTNIDQILRWNKSRQR